MAKASLDVRDTPPRSASISSTPDTRTWIEQNNAANDGEESLNVWGFADTRYQLNENGQVQITGTRYSSSGQTLPELMPWMSRRLQVDLSKVTAGGPRGLTYPPSISSPIVNEAFVQRLHAVLPGDQISQDPLIRLRHSHGHSQQDMFCVNYGKIERVTDTVLYPSNTAEVLSIVQVAAAENVQLIPYGGGTNVSQALSFPDRKTGMVATVSMCRMDRVVWVDKVNGLAKIEAGAVGRHIAKTLKDLDLTLGHEPDSFEFSTLGGWIATKASGMKKNKYGNIEDIVVDVEVVTHSGIIAPVTDAPPPRVSVLNDVKSLVFGSEGSLGIITSAIVKVFPMPSIQKYDSLLFRSFEDGIGFMKELSSSGLVPASCRLVDNTQFQFAQALRPAPTGMSAIKGWLSKSYVINYLGFDPQSMAVCTLVFEGQHDEIRAQQAAVYSLGKSHGGVKAGADAGKRGYEMTFAIAYIRDFAMTLNIMAESFETSCAWSQALDLCQRVKQRVRDEHNTRGLPGEPFISCRISQVYHSGVTVYFYLAVYSGGVENPSAVFSELEEAARDEILLNRGSLSHHHGVGNLRKNFLPRVMSATEISWRRKLLANVSHRKLFVDSRLDGMEAYVH